MDTSQEKLLPPYYIYTMLSWNNPYRLSARPLSLPTLLLLLFLFTTCSSTGNAPRNDIANINYRQEMRTLVTEIGAYARRENSGFLLVPQNGQEIMTTNGEADGPFAAAYIQAIDGVGREDLLYGYNRDDTATPSSETAYMEGFLDRARDQGITVLVTDYCTTQAKVDNSYSTNAKNGYTSFAADRRELDGIPSYPAEPHENHTGGVTSPATAKNFLYLINPSYENNVAMVAALQTKPGGKARLVLAYMSIGEAEDYRYYWDDEFGANRPVWVEEENPDWKGNYRVRYWYDEWKALLFGGPDSYLDRILAAGFDGVYLDIIDGFEYFEETY